MFRTPRFFHLLAAAAFSLLICPTLNAQKPTLVKDVDALGRAPYQQTVFFNQTASVCTNFVCTVNFNPVPAGYRLVVTHVSAQYKLGNGNAGGTTPTVEIGTNGDVSGEILLLPTPTPIGFNSYVTSSPVTYFVEAGKYPSVFLGGQFVTTDGSNTASATVVGYLISIN
jgi:hypothetical protein